MNFSSMFSDFDISKGSNENTLKDSKIKADNSKIGTSLDCSDNTLYSETESTESINNKSAFNIKQPLLQLKENNKASLKPQNKEDIIEMSLESVEKKAALSEPSKTEQLKKNSVKTAINVENIKIENEIPKDKPIPIPEKVAPADKVKESEEPPKTKKDVLKENIEPKPKPKPKELKIEKEEMLLPPVEKKEAIPKEEDVSSRAKEANSELDATDDSVAALPETSDKVEAPPADSEDQSKALESDNANHEDIDEEESKHSNMVLKEKLYNEQKNQHKIGLIKNASLLNTSTIVSSLKKAKSKQKVVQFKSSWSGELESTKRMSRDYLNYISTSRGNFIFKLNRMDIKSTCPVFFSGNFETDSIYTMFCEFKCDDEVYYTTKQYPIHGNNPTISMNEDINIPLTSDQDTLIINITMIKKTPILMPPPCSTKSSKNSNSSGMSTLTRTMTHSKKTIHQLMFWKKNKNMDGFSSVNSGAMAGFNGYDDMNGANSSSISQKNDLQFRSLSSNSSISKMFMSDGSGSATQVSNHRGRNYHPSIKTIFSNNNTSSSAIPLPSNGLSRESTMDCISGSNCSLNSTYSTNTNASTMTTSSSSSTDNVFVAGKITIDLKNLRDHHMGELIDETRWEISPPKPLQNSNTNSELPPIGSVRIRKKVMQWDGLDAPLVILNGKLNMSVFYIPDFSYKEDLFVPKTISDCLDCVDCQRWHETETKDGYLRQKGGDVNEWKRRFYRLIGEKLIAYDSESSSESKATIDLTQCKFINLLLPDPQNSQFINETLPNGEEYTTIVYLNPSESSNENFIFELVFKDDDAIEFKCESLDDMNAWCKELQIVVQEWEEFQYPNWWTELINFKEEKLNKN